MKYLVINEMSPDDWTYVEWQKNGIKAAILFKRVCKVLRAIRRYHLKSKLPLKSIWLGRWKKQISDLDVIVLHMSSLSLWIPKYINKQNPDLRIVAWYWNSVTDAINPEKIEGKCELWSFDPENCKKYNMKFNHQYYFKSLVKKDATIDKDLFFCGSDSGRGEKITKIYKELKQRGINADFRVVYPQYPGLPDEIKSDRLSYSEIVNGICSSKAIFELVREGQSGPTLRLMEAVFQGKKLVTDNKCVIEEPFYDSSKIFVLRDDNWNELVEFLNTDFEEYDGTIIDEYDVNGWIKRFGIKL